MKFRFNRNIVECKFRQVGRNDRNTGRFNRNIVECKLYCIFEFFTCLVVLIETLWNVNYFHQDGL